MKINMVSLGCPKNLVDTEKILGALGAAGAIIVSSPKDSDVIVINTCGFIAPALQETEDEIKKALKIAKIGEKRVYVIGCAVNRCGKKLREKYPGVTGWFDLEEESAILNRIIPKARHIKSRLPTTAGYAYLKVSEGCSNHCSYCTIPSIKGEYRSFDFNELVKEAFELSRLGIKEIIIIGQDTTRYGLDRYGKPMLALLIKEISNIPDIKWIRLMYAHPKSLTEAVIEQLKTNKKCCKYIDMPIQHINNRILQIMNRGVDRSRIERLIRGFKNIKLFSIRTTVIVGFPTESDENFNELFSFLKEHNIDWLGVFPYFPETGTPAANLEQLPESLIDQRYRKILKLQHDLIKRRNNCRIGRLYKTLIHGQDGYYHGHSQFESPEIDGQILTKRNHLSIGKFYNMKIKSTRGYDLYGERN